MQIDFKIEGVGNFKRGWDRVGQYFGTDARPFFEIVKSWWYHHMEKVFASEGKSIDEHWPELGALATGGPPGWYGKWKQKYHPGKPLLVLTGAMKEALTGQGPYATKDMTRTSLKLGVANIPYLKTHLEGRPQQHIPQRKYLGVTREMLRDLDTRVQSIMNALDREFRGGLGL